MTAKQASLAMANEVAKWSPVTTHASSPRYSGLSTAKNIILSPILARHGIQARTTVITKQEQKDCSNFQRKEPFQALSESSIYSVVVPSAIQTLL